MKRSMLTQEEKQAAAMWAADTSWVSRKNYEQDQEYLKCVKDILENPVFQSMDQYIQHGTTTCKEHCIQVSYMSYRICQKHGWNYRAAARAGLLHDLFLYDWHTHARETGKHFHGLTHPRVAMNNAIRYFQVDREEQDCILRHMWPLTPIPPKTMAGMAILYSDKFCGLVEVAVNMKKWISYNIGWKRAA